MIPWYEVYNLIGKGLFEFSNKCRNDGLKPGEVLFNSLSQNQHFVAFNSWCEKFEKNFNVRSIDPLHLFSSISASRLKEENRIKRIKIILDFLKIDLSITEIDFDGCPLPMAVFLISARDHDSQEEIWDLFERVYAQKVKGLKSEDFINYKKWYGVEFNSLTVFLFWINSNFFLPFDKNTELYLIKSTGFINSKPKAFTTYISLLNRIQKYNRPVDSGYGEYGLFREIALVAYLVISQNVINTDVSDDLKNLLNEQSGSKEIEYENRTGLGFKLIAIKPLTGCKFLNNLVPNQVYHFEKTIEIQESQILFHKEKNIELYKLDNGLQVNVTAIVGKNGSGKSSLIELFFRIVNNISFSLRESLKTKKLIVENGINAELYYTNLGILHKIIINDATVLIQEFNIDNDSIFFIPISEPRKLQKKDLNSFFYTIAVDYSHYSLNSSILGNWIRSIFHKNDAYQTPIVINPMRTTGNIDINRENDLATSRLIANLLMPVIEEENAGIRQITEKQRAVRIEFELIPDKNIILYSMELSGNNFQEFPYSVLDNKHIQVILQEVKKVFNFPEEFQENDDLLVKEAEKYIIRKLVRIALNYYPYSSYFNMKSNKFDIKGINQYLSKLKDDQSHVTYKLKQAINFLKYPELWMKKPRFSINIDEASENLQTFFKEYQLDGRNIIEYIPPAIFKAKIILDNANTGPSSFNLLSSGEKQLIFSASSLLYHLQNLDSVNDKRGLVKYHNVCLFLDEIELYYHPELQRKYINYLLSALRNNEYNSITALNICVITHSPYVLSDIPDNFTLKLKEGIADNSETKTFGANIHELLANEFFMENGYMGEFAKEKIKEIINYLETVIKAVSDSEFRKLKFDEFVWDKESVKKLIDFIGEPLIKNSLMDLYHKAFFNNQDQIDSEIARLQKMKDRFKQ